MSECISIIWEEEEDKEKRRKRKGKRRKEVFGVVFVQRIFWEKRPFVEKSTGRGSDANILKCTGLTYIFIGQPGGERNPGYVSEGTEAPLMSRLGRATKEVVSGNP